MIRIVIADDHVMLLDGLRTALASLPDVDVVATARNGEELIEIVREVKPAVVVVDIEMPKLSGLEALGRLDKKVQAVVVTMHADEEQRHRAEEAGAVGFLSKSAPLPDLAAAVRAAAAGEDFINPASTREILDRHQEAVLDPGAAALTDREREVLALLARGVSATDEIAEELYISQKTVKNHLANIYDKLGVNDRAQAAVEAIRLGIDGR